MAYTLVKQKVSIPRALRLRIWSENVIRCKVIEIDERLVIDDFSLHTAFADPVTPGVDRWPAARLKKFLIGSSVRGEIHGSDKAAHNEAERHNQWQDKKQNKLSRAHAIIFHDKCPGSWA